MFQDIYGVRNQGTGEQEILTISDRNDPRYTALYKISNNTASQISIDPIQWELFSPWFIPGRHYYVVGSGIYEKSSLSECKWRNDPLEFTTHMVYQIRGNSLNDIFCVGAYGEILHFNGYRWKSFIPELGILNGFYGGVALKDNLVVIVGDTETQAIITIGKRN